MKMFVYSEDTAGRAVQIVFAETRERADSLVPVVAGKTASFYHDVDEYDVEDGLVLWSWDSVNKFGIIKEGPDQ